MNRVVGIQQGGRNPTGGVRGAGRSYNDDVIQVNKHRQTLSTGAGRFFTFQIDKHFSRNFFSRNFDSRNFGEKNEQGGFHFTFRSKFWAEWAAPGRQQNLCRTGAPENEISELDLCKGLAGWSIGSVRAFGMKGSEFEPQTTHWWDRAGPCVGGNSRNLLIATSDHGTSDRLLIIDIDYQNY